ncbi:c-type cytochrome [Rubritalea marina]|uniref:c-type cytochrome n=1 Tax=Rubritalea marina TaxID=361055 RepID=UPI00037306D0|nr:cytochrome c [Rubritalea marina]
MKQLTHLQKTIHFSSIAFLLSQASHAAPSHSTTQIERGKTLYQQVCFTCHGTHLEGGIGPALGDAYWRHGDDLDSIYKVISEGVPESEMLAFKGVFPEQSDREAIAAYILSEQLGMRSLVRSKYAKAAFQGMRFSPELFSQAEPYFSKPVPENVIFFDNNFDGVSRFESQLDINATGTYYLNVHARGRCSIFLDGEEIFYSNPEEGIDADKGMKSKPLQLEAGSYQLDIFNEQKKAWQPRLHLTLSKEGGKHVSLVGRSLQGSVPKEVTAGTEAKVIRKWIRQLSPRTLLCLLPNKVIVAFNPTTGAVEKAWSQAKVNQTPSLPDRSARPSEIVGTPIVTHSLSSIQFGEQEMQALRYSQYRIDGDSAVVTLLAGEHALELRISPEGANGYSISGHSEQSIPGLEIQSASGPLPLNTQNQTSFILRVD